MPLKWTIHVYECVRDRRRNARGSRWTSTSSAIHSHPHLVPEEVLSVLNVRGMTFGNADSASSMMATMVTVLVNGLEALRPRERGIAARSLFRFHYLPCPSSCPFEKDGDRIAWNLPTANLSRRRYSKGAIRRRNPHAKAIYNNYLHMMTLWAACRTELDPEIRT